MKDSFCIRCRCYDSGLKTKIVRLKLSHYVCPCVFISSVSLGWFIFIRIKKDRGQGKDNVTLKTMMITKSNVF